MSKILMLKGLPASGKSTYAKELVARGGWKRVNKDDLRAMLDNSKWSKANEKFVLRIRDLLVTEALNAQLSVVVDDTNFNPIHETRLRAIADDFKVPFEVKFFDTPLEECLERNIHRAAPVREHVITDMYKKFIKKPPAVIEHEKDLPYAVMVDIDGTLAHGIGDTRKPYEWDKVSTDSIDTTIAGLVAMLSKDAHIIYMSGRNEVCREDTIEWLSKHSLWYGALHMRAEDDSRKDSIVKRELYEKHVKGQYNVLFVLDDRNQVVEMWRDLGLKVLQVADGDF